MKTKLFPLLAAVTLGLTACRHPAPPPTAEAHEHASHGARLELNHGKRWMVPPPMMAHIQNIERAVIQLETAPTRNHAALAATIREQLGELVTKCTMEGKAHDELHKWLMPFLGLSEDYFKTNAPRVQEEKFRDLQRSLAQFHRYFE